jgi:hypothetical protein
MINTKLQNIIDTKSAIGNAIVNKGGTITSETPFFNYAAQIDGISTGGGAYSTFVAQAQDNSLYTVYNGYDFTTNPTPNLSNNFAFNRWLLNNSATGDVVLSNVVVANGGTFNGPNTVANEANLPFVNNTASYGEFVVSITTNNGFLYVGGKALTGTNRGVSKFHESNLVIVGNTVNYGGDGSIRSIAINNGFIYAGGFNGATSANWIGSTVRKYGEGNLTFIENSANYGSYILSVAINNGFIYAGGSGNATANRNIKKYHESNLVFVSNTVGYGGDIEAITTNDGFIYVGGSINRTLQKFGESNLSRVGNTADYGGTIKSIATNNGFVYIAGFGNETVHKYYESNLGFVGNTSSYGNDTGIYSVKIMNGFIYVGGFGNATANGDVKKYYESNLSFVGNTASRGATIQSVATNNGFIYAGGFDIFTVNKYSESGTSQEQLPFYNITNIKE